MKVLNKRGAPIRVVILLTLLSFSLFITGICGAMLVWKSHEAYQGIVSRELPTLALLRDVARVGSATRRAVNTYADTSIPAIRSERLVDFEEAVVRNNKNLESLRKYVLKDGHILLNNLLDSRLRYVEAARGFLHDPEGVAALKSEKREHLEDLYRVYIANQDILADYAEKQAASKSEKIISDGRTLYIIFLAVALWPLLISLLFFACGILTTAYSLFRSQR